MFDQRTKIPHPEQRSQKKKKILFECSTKTIYVTFIKKQKSTVRPKKAFFPSIHLENYFIRITRINRGQSVIWISDKQQIIFKN